MPDLPDLSSAEVVSDTSVTPDLSSAVPVEDLLAPQARDLVNQHAAGEITLPQDKLEQAIKLSQAGKGAWGRAGDWLRNYAETVGNPIKGAKLAYNILDQAATGTAKAFGQIEQPFVTAYDKLQNAPNIIQGLSDAGNAISTGTAKNVLSFNEGVASGAAKMLPVIGGVANEAADLIAQPLGVDMTKEDVGFYQFEHDLNQVLNKSMESTGVSPEEPLVKAGELGSMALLPGGAEAKLASTIARAAETTVDVIPKVTGGALKATAKTAKTVGPAAIAGAELTHGHPIAALATMMAGYGEGIPFFNRIKHFIMDKGVGAIDNLANVLLDKPYGQTTFSYIQDGIKEDAANIQARIEDMRANASPDSLTRLDKPPNADGTPFYRTDQLPKEAKEIRLDQEELSKLNDSATRLQKYVNANRILADGSKYVLRSAGNLGVAAGVGAAFTSAGAAPEDKQAQEQGMGMGMLLGLPGLHGANTYGKYKMQFDEMVSKGKKIIDPESVKDLHPDMQNDIYAHAALVKPLNGKVEIIAPDELLSKSTEGMPPEKGAVAPNGFFDPKSNTLYLNRDALQSGVAGHEFTHLAQEQLTKSFEPINKDILDRINSSDVTQSEPYKEFAKYYEERMRTTRPDFTDLTPEQITSEVQAEIGRQVLANLSPTEFYGGKSGGRIVKDWLAKKLGKKDASFKTVDSFGAPYLGQDAANLKDIFYQIGEKAKLDQTFPAKKTLADLSVKSKSSNESIDPEIVKSLKKKGFTDEQIAKLSPEDISPKLMPSPEEVEDISDKKAERYFDIAQGQDDEMKLHDNWIYDTTSKSIKSRKGGTHGANFSHEVADQSFKGWHDSIQDKISVVFPESEMKKLGLESYETPTEGDIPANIRYKLQKKFGKTAEMHAFMPSPIDQPASQIDGMIFKGSPETAKEKARDFGISKKKIGLARLGFVKKNGEWIDENAARLEGEETDQLPASAKDKLTVDDLMNERRFMPSSHPDAIDKPAMRRRSDGKIFIAKNAGVHWMMPNEIPALKDRYTLGGADRYEDGWVDKKKKFYNKDQAHEQAVKIGQIERGFKTEYRGSLSSLDLREGAKYMPVPGKPAVNIGLHTNEGGKITQEEAIAALKKHGIDATKTSIHQSNTEPTLVASLSRPLTPEEAHQVSLDLKQEAIAQHANGIGELYGPKAENWKPFNPDYFLNHETKIQSTDNTQTSINGESQASDQSLRQTTSKEKSYLKDLGPIIDLDLSPEEQRFQELFHKEDQGLTPTEEKELNDLTFGIFKKYGSVENFEKRFPAKEQKFMPAQTRAPEFKKWFGDSKVKDEEGNPIVVYHGTNQDFSNFSKEKQGAMTGVLSAKEGMFFTDSPEVASDYAAMAARRSIVGEDEHLTKVDSLLKRIEQAEKKRDFNTSERLTTELEDLGLGARRDTTSGQALYPTYLSIKNPKQIDVSSISASAFDLSKAIKEAKEQGHDGLILRNSTDNPSLMNSTSSNHYVVFKPEQIKSATGNKGTFDSSNPDIRFMPAPQEYEKVANDLSLRYEGLSLGGRAIAFTDQKTGSTIDFPQGISPEDLASQIKSHRKSFIEAKPKDKDELKMMPSSPEGNLRRIKSSNVPQRFYWNKSKGAIIDRLTDRADEVISLLDTEEYPTPRSIRELVDEKNQDGLPLPPDWTGSHPDAWIPEAAMKYPDKDAYGIFKKFVKGEPELVGEYKTIEEAYEAIKQAQNELYSEKPDKNLAIEDKRPKKKKKSLSDLTR